MARNRQISKSTLISSNVRMDIFLTSSDGFVDEKTLHRAGLKQQPQRLLQQLNEPNKEILDFLDYYLGYLDSKSILLLTIVSDIEKEIRNNYNNIKGLNRKHSSDAQICFYISVLLTIQIPNQCVIYFKLKYTNIRYCCYLKILSLHRCIILLLHELLYITFFLFSGRAHVFVDLNVCCGIPSVKTVLMNYKCELL